MKCSNNPAVSIAYCTVCMNRLHHLKKTLPSNLEANSEFMNVQFLLLDYNSSDDLEQWVRTNFNHYMQSGYLTYYKYTEALAFNRSHSRNMIFKLADADVVCNVDADNIISGSYTKYVLKQFGTNSNIFITADGNIKHSTTRDTFGRFCCKKEDFLLVGGYDEGMQGYGYEDSDIYNRIERLGRERVLIGDAGLLRAILHEDIDRVKNDSLFLNLNSIYAADVGDEVFQLVILLNDGLFVYITLFPGKYRDEPFGYGVGGKMTGVWEKGRNRKNGFSLMPANGKKMIMHALTTQQDMFSLSFNGKKVTFKKLKTPEEIGMAMITYMMVCNHERFQSNKRYKRIAVNENSFGKGYVYRNFDLATPIPVL